MSNLELIVLGSGVIAILYGIFTTRSLMAVSGGTERMAEIAAAIQEGAAAYLNRQYTTIGIVGLIVTVILVFTLGMLAALAMLRDDS